jgi:peptidoglycan/LPS O-acetylase OafA/YrhL
MPDKLQQEIEDLLARLDTFPPRRSPIARAWDAVRGWFRGTGRTVSSVRLPRLNAGHVLLIAIAVIVIAYLGLPGGGLTRWIIAGAVVAFIAAFILSLRRQSQPPEKLWRGKPMDLRGPGVGERLWSWLGRRRPGR